MVLNYNLMIIENDKTNNIFLFSHKISQWLKNNIKQDFGIFANIDNNWVEVKIEQEFSLKELETFLKKTIKIEKKQLEINDGDSFIVQTGFKNNHIKNIVDKSLINSKDVTELGYLPNIMISKGSICHYLSQKPIIPIGFSEVQFSGFQNVKLNYTHEHQVRRMSLNVQSFLIKNCQIKDVELFKNMCLFGFGFKKSYGFSNIIKI